MVYKDPFMWEQVVFSIGKLYTGMGLNLCRVYLNRPHLVLGVGPVVVAADPRNRQKILQRFIGNQKGKI